MVVSLVVSLVVSSDHSFPYTHLSLKVDRKRRAGSIVKEGLFELYEGLLGLYLNREHMRREIPFKSRSVAPYGSVRSPSYDRVCVWV